MKGLEAGDTFANWGRFFWANTFQAIRSGKSFQVLRVGDGLADGGMLYNASLVNLTNYFPLAGFMGVKKGLFDAAVSGAASRQTPQSGLWLPQWWLITDSGGTVTSAYGSHIYPDGLPAKVGARYYLGETRGRPFSIPTKHNTRGRGTVRRSAN